MSLKGRIILAGFCAMAVAACASPEARLKTALVNIGLPANVAGCMSGRMVDRLTSAQLDKLASLNKLKKKKASEISMEEFLRRTRALQDGEILAVTSSSALVCAIKA